MWQPTIPVLYQGRALTGAEAWIRTFAQAWEKLELDPEKLNMGGLEVFGAAVLAKHGDEAPAAVAARLYPNAGEHTLDLYPGYREPIAEQPTAQTPEWERLKDEDVPF